MPKPTDPVAAAIAAVEAFCPDLNRVGVAHLLSYWRWADRLTPEQTRMVVDHFADLPPVQHCPGCGSQLPENAGCQNPGCDGIAPAPVECDQPATRAVVAYPIPFGLRGQTHFVCHAHLAAAVAGIEAAGMLAEHGPGILAPWGSRCGDVIGRDGGEPAPVECDQPPGDSREFDPDRCDHCSGPLTPDGRCWLTILDQEAAHADRAIKAMEAAARRRQGGER